MKRRALPLLFFAFPLGLLAEGKSSVVAEFLTLPVGERAVGMGEAGAALSTDATALFWNPASLMQTPRTSVALGRVPYSDGAAQDHLAGSRAIGTGVMGVGYGAFTHGSIEGSDPDGFSTGGLTPRENQIILGYARQFPAIPFLAGHGWGLAVKQVSSKLENTAETYSWDMGLLSKPYREGRFRWGFSSMNNGGALKYNEEREPLPRTTRAGAVWTPVPQWIAAADFVKRTNAPIFWAGGVEYAKRVGTSLRVFTRAGYSTEEKSPNGLRLGLGVGVKNLRVDYFYRLNEAETATQGVGLTFEWDERGKGLPPALQARIDRGNRLIETGQYPEAVIAFHDALKTEPTCQEARDGLERAYRLMQGR